MYFIKILIFSPGVDDVFVFINTFRQAGHIGNHGDRLAHTLTTAGLATFFTSLTTAAAFAANIASAVRIKLLLSLFLERANIAILLCPILCHALS